MNQASARDCLWQALQQPDAAIDWAAAALYIAQEDYPELVVEDYLHRLDVMAAQLRDRLPATPYPLKIIQAINDYLFEVQGFGGNHQDYYDPRNSFLNQVLERRTGIPITLSLVYLELAKRIDFPMAGVGMPGHFLVRPTLAEMAIFVDPFHQGEVLFAEDCRDRLKHLYGQAVSLQPQHLAPVGPRPFLIRLLTNLKLIYLQRQDLPRALAAIDRILLLAPATPLEYRDRGLLYYRAGQLAAAREDLTAYLHYLPEARDAFEVQQVIRQINRTLGT